MIQFILERRYFEKDDTQNYLVFQPIQRHLKKVSGAGTGNYTYFWKSKRLTDENITASSTSDYNFNPQLSYLGNKIRVEIEVTCSKQDKVSYNYDKIVNIYIVYEISKNFNISTYLTLPNLYLEQLV